MFKSFLNKPLPTDVYLKKRKTITWFWRTFRSSFSFLSWFDLLVKSQPELANLFLLQIGVPPISKSVFKSRSNHLAVARLIHELKLQAKFLEIVYYLLSLLLYVCSCNFVKNELRNSLNVSYT